MTIIVSIEDRFCHSPKLHRYTSLNCWCSEGVVKSHSLCNYYLGSSLFSHVHKKWSYNKHGNGWVISWWFCLVVQLQPLKVQLMNVIQGHSLWLVSLKKRRKEGIQTVPFELLMQPQILGRILQVAGSFLLNFWCSHIKWVEEIKGMAGVQAAPFELLVQRKLGVSQLEI